ncbi:MAG: hypothetical protein WBF90_09120 [Rivularia sp. (in: cyanobacteria)]
MNYKGFYFSRLSFRIWYVTVSTGYLIILISYRHRHSWVVRDGIVKVV